MQFRVLIISLAMATQIAAFPAGTSDSVATPGHAHLLGVSSPPTKPFGSRSVEVLERDNTNPAKHEANEQKDKASAEAKEKKEQAAQAKAKAATAKGDTAGAAKQSQKAEEEEGREQTAKKHADTAEKKEQAAKAGEAKKPKGN